VYFGGGRKARFYCILRGRWKSLRDRSGPSNALNNTVLTSVPSKVRNCAVPPDYLRSAISFSRSSNIINLIRKEYIA